MYRRIRIILWRGLGIDESNSALSVTILPCHIGVNGPWLSLVTKENSRMAKTSHLPAKSRKRAMIKAFLLIAFFVAAIYIVRFTPVKGFLTRQALSNLLETTGFGAPLIFILVYAAGVCLFVPGTLLTALGAALFGAYWGFAYVWVGAMAGATASFWIGRTLGREFAVSLIGDRLKKYDDAIERNGFATVLYLRLVYFPFTPLNFGMGLTRIRFWDYFL